MILRFTKIYIIAAAVATLSSSAISFASNLGNASLGERSLGETSPTNERWVDPLGRFSFESPSQEWSVGPGLGSHIAYLHDDKGANIRLSWLHSAPPIILRQNISAYLPEIWRGADISPITEIKKGKQNSYSVIAELHDFQSGVQRLLALFVPIDNGVLRILCEAKAKRFVEIVFECRRLGLSVSTSPQDKANAKQISFSAEHALEDGRIGCPGVRGAKSALSQVASLAQSGRREAGKHLLENISSKHDGAFAALWRARMALEDSDVKTARHYLSSAPKGSQLVVALEIWANELEGDVAAARLHGEKFDDDFCGESGALAAHHLGLAIQDSDPGKAESLFETAIKANPSYTQAYFSLGQILLDRGNEALVVLERMHTLLTKAPKTPEIVQFRKDITRQLSTVGL